MHVGASGETASDISAEVARGSFGCLYLINAFSTLVDCVESVAELRGLASRLTDLTAAADLTDAALGCGKTGFADTCCVESKYPTCVFGRDTAAIERNSAFSSESRASWYRVVSGALFGRRRSSSQQGNKPGRLTRLQFETKGRALWVLSSPLSVRSDSVDQLGEYAVLSSDSAVIDRPPPRNVDSHEVEIQAMQSNITFASYEDDSVLRADHQASECALLVVTNFYRSLSGGGQGRSGVSDGPSKTPRVPVSFSVTRGMRLLIFGPSGIGKTTLLRMLAGIIPPSLPECPSTGAPSLQQPISVQFNCQRKDVFFVPQVPYLVPVSYRFIVVTQIC